MRCRKVRSFLSTYCKDETSPELTADIKSHLKECGSCRREETVFRSMNKLLHELPQYKTSDGFSARLFERIGQERFAEKKSKAYLPGRIPKFGRARLAAVTVAALMVLSVGLSLSLVDKITTPGPSLMANSDQGQMDDSYLTVQPTNNPFFSQTKSLGSLVQQYNRWRGYSQSLLSHDDLVNEGSAILTSSNAAVHSAGLPIIRIRPVTRNYIIVPVRQPTSNGGDTY
jgi:hypothetical protein